MSSKFLSLPPNVCLGGEGTSHLAGASFKARVAPDRSSASKHELPCVLSIKKSLRYRSKNGDTFRENTRSAKKEEKGGLPLFLISVPE